MDRALAQRPDPGRRVRHAAPSANGPASPRWWYSLAALGIGACSTIFGGRQLRAVPPAAGRTASRLMSVPATTSTGKSGLSISFPNFRICARGLRSRA